MSVGQDLEIQFGQIKCDVRIIFFRLGILQTLLLKNHIVREVGPFPMSCHICDRLWEKVRCRAYFQNRVIGTTGLSKLSAIKCTTRSVVKVTCCGVMTVSIQSFLFTQRSKSSRKR